MRSSRLAPRGGGGGAADRHSDWGASGVLSETEKAGTRHPNANKRTHGSCQSPTERKQLPPHPTCCSLIPGLFWGPGGGEACCANSLNLGLEKAPASQDHSLLLWRLTLSKPAPCWADWFGWRFPDCSAQFVFMDKGCLNSVVR